MILFFESVFSVTFFLFYITGFVYLLGTGFFYWQVFYLILFA